MVVAELVVVEVVRNDGAMVRYAAGAVACLAVGLGFRKELHMVLEKQGCFGVNIHFRCEIEVALWAQVLQIIYFPVAEILYPLWPIIPIGLFYVKTPSFNIQR